MPSRSIAYSTLHRLLANAIRRLFAKEGIRRFLGNHHHWGEDVCVRNGRRDRGIDNFRTIDTMDTEGARIDDRFPIDALLTSPHG